MSDIGPGSSPRRSSSSSLRVNAPISQSSASRNAPAGIHHQVMVENWKLVVRDSVISATTARTAKTMVLTRSAMR